MRKTSRIEYSNSTDSTRALWRDALSSSDVDFSSSYSPWRKSFVLNLIQRIGDILNLPSACCTLHSGTDLGALAASPFDC